MTFASAVTINGNRVGAVVAVVSVRDLARSVVGTAPAKDDDLWKAGLPIIFVVDGNGRTNFHPDPSLAA